MKPWYKSGATGWLLIAGLVAGWDYAVAGRYGGETLTGAFRRGIRALPLIEDPPRKRKTPPLAPILVTAAWGLTTLHLYGRLPPKFDPYHHITVWMSRTLLP